VLKHETTRADNGEFKNGAHFLDLFYLGIAYFELQDYNNAIAAFDRSLQQYPNFSDAKYYKARCITLKGDTDKGAALMKEAQKDFNNGYTINEDNAAYETYPYQVSWQWGPRK